MKKSLICVENLDSYICAQTNKVYCDKNTIITASAKDLCSSKGVEIIYDVAPYGGCAQSVDAVSKASPKAEKSCCGCSSSNENTALKSIISENTKESVTSCCKSSDPFEKVLIKLALMIQQNFGINDMAKLRELSLEAAKIIKNNLN